MPENLLPLSALLVLVLLLMLVLVLVLVARPHARSMVARLGAGRSVLSAAARRSAARMLRPTICSSAMRRGCWSRAPSRWVPCPGT